MKTKLNRIISALLIAILASANIAQTGLAEGLSRPAATFTAPSFCPNATDDSSRADLIFDDFEPGAPTHPWSYGFTTGSIKWELKTPGILDAYSLWGDDPASSNDSWAKIEVSLDSNTTYYLYFKHQFNLEYSTTYQKGYDGGVLEYSTDSGATWIDARPFFSAGQDYNATMGNVNDLGTRPAFSGISDGIVASRYDLSGLAGETVSFRWRIVTDGGIGKPGWYVDNVEVYTCPSNTKVYVGETLKGSYNVLQGTLYRLEYPNVAGGPIHFVGTSPFLASIRTLHNGSFAEVIGFPTNKLTTDYWLLWYNNITLSSQLRVGNPSATETAKVEIYIGGQKMSGGDVEGVQTGSTYSLAPGQMLRLEYPNKAAGPVHFVSIPNGNGLTMPILASMRTINAGSYDEIKAYPGDQFTTDYWLLFYNNITFASQLRIGNPDPTETAKVEIYIGGQKMSGGDLDGVQTGSTYTLTPGQMLRLEYPGKAGGPIHFVSIPNGNGVTVPILASMRTLHNGWSFAEIFAYPTNQIDQVNDEHTLLWYNNITLSSQLRVGNPSATEQAKVEIYIGGQKMSGGDVDGVQTGSTYTLAPGQMLRLEYPNTAAGPIRYVSIDNGSGHILPILASMRTINAGSFQELFAYPIDQLTTDYWLLFYNYVTFASQLRVGIP